MVGAISPLTAFRGNLAREVAVGSARDALAASVIAEAADEGNELAAAFASEAQELLGVAGVHRARAYRIREGAVEAAAMGLDSLATIGADAALLEDREADRIEGSVCQAVRESHSPGMYGYVSPEERRLLSRKTRMDQMTAGQLEQAYKSQLSRMYATAANYGAEGDDDDELGDDGGVLERLGVAADLFGGDLPAVFGDDAYGKFWDVFKPSREKLLKRLERKQAKLAKKEAKLEELEDAGKKGVRLKMLRGSVRRLEKAISRIKGKLGKLEKSGVKVARSEKKAEKVQRAEAEQVREAAEPDDEDEGADDDESDEEDEDLMAAIDVFGITQRRRRKIRRRLRRLRRRRAKARSPRKRRRLQKRIRRLRGRLGPRRPRGYLVSQPTPMPYAVNHRRQTRRRGRFGTDEEVGRQVFIGFFDRRQTAYGGDGIDVDEYGGKFWDGFKKFWKGVGTGIAAPFKAIGKKKGGGKKFRPFAVFKKKGGGGKKFRPFKVFKKKEGGGKKFRPFKVFKKKEGGGKKFQPFKKLKADSGYRRQARVARREARSPHTPGVREDRGDLRESTGVRRKAGKEAWQETYRQAKGKPPGAVRQADVRIVPGIGGYVYQQNTDGSILIIKDPKNILVSASNPIRVGVNPGTRNGVLTAWQAITNEISPVVSGAYGAKPGLLQTLLQPGTNRERAMLIAEQLDQAIEIHGPESPIVQRLARQQQDVNEEAQHGPDSSSLMDEDEDLELDEIEAEMGYTYG